MEDDETNPANQLHDWSSVIKGIFERESEEHEARYQALMDGYDAQVIKIMTMPHLELLDFYTHSLHAGFETKKEREIWAKLNDICKVEILQRMV